MRVEPPVPAEALAAIRAALAAAGAEAVDAPILQPLGLLLDLAGEAMRARLFVVQAEGGPNILVNEIAPRVHNSGHWTLDGASISQFEQHIRAIAGWSLGKPVRHGEVTMTNLIGDEINSYTDWLSVPGATVHVYGKGTPRPGRKMGHVTQVIPPKTA